MTRLRDEVMLRLYERDIWEGFEPIEVGDCWGWNGDHTEALKIPAQCIVDVGVWLGQSTITFASAMKDRGIDGVVVAVDTFLGSPELWRLFDQSPIGRKNGLPNLYWHFLSHVAKAGLQEYVVPMPQTSACAAITLKQVPLAPDLVYLDAAHDHKSVLRDCEDYWDLLRDGGTLVGDDYISQFPGVVTAVAAFSESVNRTFNVVAPKWIMEK
jgi:hypothetical protein